MAKKPPQSSGAPAPQPTRRLGQLPPGTFGTSAATAPKAAPISQRRAPSGGGQSARPVVESARPGAGFEPWGSGGFEPWGFEPWGRISPGSFLPRWSEINKPAKTDGRMQGASHQKVVCLGWQPDVPDPRDFPLPKAVNALNVALAARGNGPDFALKLMDDAALPAWVDLRSSGWLPPVEDQGPLGSCTAQSVVGVLETLAKSTHAEWTDLSRLFLYKVTRNLLQWTGDTGAYLRSTVKAAALFGVPPEEFLPYIVADFENEPSAFLYQFATSFKATTYARLDTFDPEAGGTPGVQARNNLKRALAGGHSAAFGFPVFASMQSPKHWLGEIPYPRTSGDRQLGGHAVQAIGYNDDLIVEGPGGADTPGAVIFRNSWSTDWGDGGFGYLPYAYFDNGLAVDCWTIFNADWVDDSVFA